MSNEEKHTFEFFTLQRQTNGNSNKVNSAVPNVQRNTTNKEKISNKDEGKKDG